MKNNKQKNFFSEASEQDFLAENVLSSMKDSLIILDENQKIKHVNGSTLKLLNYSAEELQGKSYSLVIEDKDFFEIEAGGGNRYLETSYRKRDGQKVPVSLSRSEILGESEHFRGHVLVAQDITVRKQREETINLALHEKIVMVQEIHDRVKNNLQIINSLIRMQIRSFEDDRLTEFLSSVERRIQSISLVHEILYQVEDLSHISTKIYLKKLVAALLQSDINIDRRHDIAFDVQDVLLDISKAVPYGLIAHELLSNCLKHAFPNGKKGQVRIGFHKGSDKRSGVISVSDDGVGFPDNFNLEETKSLGIRLVKIFASQLQGTLEINQNGNSEVRVEFPLVGKVPSYD